MSLWNPGSDYEPTVGLGGGDHLQALEPLAAPPDVAVDGRLTEKLPFSEKEATHRLQVKGLGFL